MGRFAIGMVTTGGLGLLRPAPGTWGSLPPVVLAGALLGAGADPMGVTGVLAIVIVVFVLACVLYGDAAEARWYAKDPSPVVADETAGMSLALLALPAEAVATPGRTVLTLVYAFLCFRILDIVKPWPARSLQRVPGGWGIVLDDLFAGLYALILVQVVTRTMLAPG